MDYYQSISTAMDFAFRAIEPEPFDGIPNYNVIKSMHGWQIIEHDGTIDTTIAMCFGSEDEAWNAVEYLIETGV